MDQSARTELDLLAERLLEARFEFDRALHAKRNGAFPEDLFGLLWDAVQAYYVAMKGRDWIHRSVARELSGFREYLQLQGFRTPGDFLSKADRMEGLVFSEDDPYFVGIEPPGDEE